MGGIQVCMCTYFEKTQTNKQTNKNKQVNLPNGRHRVPGMYFKKTNNPPWMEYSYACVDTPRKQTNKNKQVNLPNGWHRAPGMYFTKTNKQISKQQTCPMGGTEHSPVFQPCWFQCTKCSEGCSFSMFRRMSDMLTFPLSIRAQAR